MSQAIHVAQAACNTQTVRVVVLLAVDDEDALFAHAGEVHGTPVADLAGAICEGVCNPEAAPLEAGYEIVAKTAYADGALHALCIDCRVHDAAKVMGEARDVYGACWGDKNWRPEDLEEALYEILVASNANPSPSEIGFSLAGLESQKQAAKDVTAPSPARPSC